MTILGSSTHLILLGLAREADVPLPTSIFQLAYLGLPTLMVGIAYLVLASPYLLPRGGNGTGGGGGAHGGGRRGNEGGSGWLVPTDHPEEWGVEAPYRVGVDGGQESFGFARDAALPLQRRTVCDRRTSIGHNDDKDKDKEKDNRKNIADEDEDDEESRLPLTLSSRIQGPITACDPTPNPHHVSGGMEGGAGRTSKDVIRAPTMSWLTRLGMRVRPRDPPLGDNIIPHPQGRANVPSLPHRYPNPPIAAPSPLLLLPPTAHREPATPYHPRSSSAPLPRRRPLTGRAQIPTGSPLAGRSIRGAGLRGLPEDLYVTAVDRTYATSTGRWVTNRTPVVSPGFVLDVGDVLEFSGDVTQLPWLAQRLGLVVAVVSVGVGVGAGVDDDRQEFTRGATGTTSKTKNKSYVALAKETGDAPGERMMLGAPPPSFPPCSPPGGSGGGVGEPSRRSPSWCSLPAHPDRLPVVSSTTTTSRDHGPNPHQHPHPDVHSHTDDRRRRSMRLHPYVPRTLALAVVSPGGYLVGRTVRTSQFRSRYDAAVLTIFRRGVRVNGRLGDHQWKSGDLILVELGPAWSSSLPCGGGGRVVAGGREENGLDLDLSDDEESAVEEEEEEEEDDDDPDKVPVRVLGSTSPSFSPFSSSSSSLSSPSSSYFPSLSGTLSEMVSPAAQGPAAAAARPPPPPPMELSEPLLSTRLLYGPGLRTTFSLVVALPSSGVPQTAREKGYRSRPRCGSRQRDPSPPQVARDHHHGPRDYPSSSDTRNAKRGSIQNQNQNRCQHQDQLHPPTPHHPDGDHHPDHHHEEGGGQSRDEPDRPSFSSSFFRVFFPISSCWGFVRLARTSLQAWWDRRGLWQGRAQAWLTVVVVVTMVVTVAVDWVSLPIAATTAACVVLLTRCVTEEAARAALPWEIITTIALSFGTSAATQKSGLADLLARGLVSACDHLPRDVQPQVTLFVLYLVAAVLSNVISNAATAVLVFPIAVAAAADPRSRGLDLVRATHLVMMGASAVFLSPFGYQTNLMVFSVGGYRWSTFVAVGLPLQTLSALVALAVIWYEPLWWIISVVAGVGLTGAVILQQRTRNVDGTTS